MCLLLVFFFNDTATTEIYTLSLHDALPIYGHWGRPVLAFPAEAGRAPDFESWGMIDAVGDLIEAGRVKVYCVDTFDAQDRKSTRLNSSHANISYAVFCLKKKNKTKYKPRQT